jgi:hypothetical protein
MKSIPAITVGSYDVPGFGCVDVVEQNDEAGDRFWDLFGSTGQCLSEGNPFWKKPTSRQVEQFLAAQSQPKERKGNEHK